MAEGAAGQSAGPARPTPLGPRYDQSTQLGRFRHFLDISDPRCLFPSALLGLSLDEGRDALARAGPAERANPSERLWLASKVYSAAVHPDTGETIPQPFRMSGYAVYGSPIVVGMLLPNPAGNIAQTVFWQWANHTHNACVNYANRNASSPTSLAGLAGGYAAAVGTSVTIAVGLVQALKRSALPQATKAAMSRFIAFPSVASANIANVVLMRYSELSSGITVRDSEGVDRGVSQKAARQAIFDTALTRVVLPMPLLLLPAAGMNALEKHTLLFKRAPSLRLPVNAAFCVAAFMVGLPAALSLFPQDGAADVGSLEPRFHGLVDSSGRPVTSLSYNKGL